MRFPSARAVASGLAVCVAVLALIGWVLSDSLSDRLSAVEAAVASPGVAAAASLPGTAGGIVWTDLVAASDVSPECADSLPVFDSSEVACLPPGSGASQRASARVMLLAAGFPEETLDQAVSDDLAVVVRDPDLFRRTSRPCLTGDSASELPILSCEHLYTPSEIGGDDGA